MLTERIFTALDDEDITILRTYGQGPYAKQLKQVEEDIKATQKRVNEKMGSSAFW